MRRTRTILPLILTLFALGLAACGGASDESSSDSTATAGSGDGGGASATLSLVAYSTPEVVYDEIIPDFRKTAEGENVEFKTSFGASGEQSRAVEGGLPADVVSFSIEPDMERLVKADLVDAGWKSAPHDGLVTTSVVSFIVRKVPGSGRPMFGIGGGAGGGVGGLVLDAMLTREHS